MDKVSAEERQRLAEVGIGVEEELQIQPHTRNKTGERKLPHTPQPKREKHMNPEQAAHKADVVREPTNNAAPAEAVMPEARWLHTMCKQTNELHQELNYQDKITTKAKKLGVSFAVTFAAVTAAELLAYWLFSAKAAPAPIDMVASAIPIKK